MAVARSRSSPIRAHLIREVRKLTTSHRHQAPLGPRLLDLGDRIFAPWHRFRADMIDCPTRQAELAPLQVELRHALEAGLDPPHTVVAGALCGNLLAGWPARWTFARVDWVEPTSASASAAERALHPAVLWRNGSFGTQSPDRGRFVERLPTVATPTSSRAGGSWTAWPRHHRRPPWPVAAVPRPGPSHLTISSSSPAPRTPVGPRPEA